MKTFALVGHTGRGKSDAAKSILAVNLHRDKVIFDVNGEYGFGDRYPDYNSFLEDAEKARNSYIVFEEATIFVNSAKQERVVNLLVRKRHTNNVVILLFHSLLDLPPFVARLVDYIYLFKTNDSDTAVFRKFKDDNMILLAYEKVKKNASDDNTKENFHYREIIKR